jgi:biopolymer transport protein ExbD
MPVKLGSKLPAESEARIEIIPLIDIMFFLLASFMLVSLSMVQLKVIKVDLPTASASSGEGSKDLITISVNESGLAFLDGNPIGNSELALRLATTRQTNSATRVLVRGDRNARHGDVVRVLVVVQSAGIVNAGIEIRGVGKDGQ